MGRDALIKELRQKQEHFGVLLSFLESDYTSWTHGRLRRLEEALDVMKEIVFEMQDSS